MNIPKHCEHGQNPANLLRKSPYPELDEKHVDYSTSGLELSCRSALLLELAPQSTRWLVYPRNDLCVGIVAGWSDARDSGRRRDSLSENVHRTDFSKVEVMLS